MSGPQTKVDRNVWVENLFRPLALGIMVGCIAWSLIQVVLIFVPDWNPTYLLVGCVLAPIDAYYSHRLLKSPRMRGANTIRFRVAEWLLILIFLKLGRYIGRSDVDLLAEMRRWPSDLDLLFDSETMAAFVLALVCWWVATETAGDLYTVGEPPERRPNYVSPVQRLTARFFGGGAVLLVAAGLSRLFPFRWLFWLFGNLVGDSQPMPEFEMPEFEAAAPPPSGGGTGADWFVVVRALVFWTLLLGVAFYVSCQAQRAGQGEDADVSLHHLRS